MSLIINKLKIFYDEDINGGGKASIIDALDVINLLTKNKNECKSVLEWCSGPGFFGFGLLSLSNFDIETLTLVDVHEPVKEFIESTIYYNKLTNVKFYQSYNFDNVPKQKFDLIVGNPPHFCIDPFSKLYDNPRKYKDENWQIHRNFFNNVNDYLSDNGRIILQENCWGSGPEVFRPMIEENNLKIEYSIRSTQYSNELWYLSVVKA